jgi:hypothetical protein
LYLEYWLSRYTLLPAEKVIKLEVRKQTGNSVHVGCVSVRIHGDKIKEEEK